MNIMAAKKEDAEAICLVIKESISELCILDHKNSPEILGPWLENKTPDNIREWIAGYPEGWFVARLDSEIVGVGAANAAGVIMLNYIKPKARFKGISKALLDRIEQQIRSTNVEVATLVSTMTALPFYEGRGYEIVGDIRESFGGKLSYPMEKSF